MKFFSLKTSSGKDVGCVPQTESIRGEISLVDLGRIIPYHKIEFDLNLSYFQLAYKAKLTDIVSTGMINAPGFIVSLKVKNTLETFKISDHQFIPATVCYRDKMHNNYFWLQIAEDNAKDIIFTQSQILSFKPSPWEIPGWDDELTTLNISSFDEFVIERKKAAGIKSLTAQTLTFKKCLSNRDLIVVSGFNQRIIVTEALKVALENNKINGMQFEPIAFPIQFE